MALHQKRTGTGVFRHRGPGGGLTGRAPPSTTSSAPAAQEEGRRHAAAHFSHGHIAGGWGAGNGLGLGEIQAQSTALLKMMAQQQQQQQQQQLGGGGGGLTHHHVAKSRHGRLRDSSSGGDEDTGVEEGEAYAEEPEESGEWVLPHRVGGGGGEGLGSHCHIICAAGCACLSTFVFAA